MKPEEQQSILVIALYAAFADGIKAEREREEVRRIAASLADAGGGIDLAGLYQDVLLKRTSLAGAAAALDDTGQRQLAYEMAVCVCEADGRLCDAERRFLDELKALLKLDSAVTGFVEKEIDTLVGEMESAVPPATAATATAGPVVAAVPSVSAAELDKSILNYAMVNGALELLPQSWASMASIPLQVKLVCGIGKAPGVELDQGHIKEVIAAAGVGLTSQYLEQFGRKLLGGLLGKVAGKTIGKLGGAATGMAFSFATTYALGQAARRYYAGGRTMTPAMLRDSFQNLLEPAKQMQAQYLPQIRQQAETLDMGRVMAMVRGN
ncbi:MAG: DUF533 domain-containing protein [Sterolibacteriaceae bacterium]|nr:DUF533 domain-containing protein [Sterolibacteriaceae bacterium]